jgi:hypothetical protein
MNMFFIFHKLYLYFAFVRLRNYIMKKIIIFIIFYFSFLTFDLCFAQFGFIYKNHNTDYLKKPAPMMESKDKSIPKINFKFDSIRPLTELITDNGEGNPWLSKDENRIYYTVGPTPYTVDSPSKIYMADKKAGSYKFTNPRALSFNSNNKHIFNYSEWLTNDELNIFYIQNIDSTDVNPVILYHAKRDSISQDFTSPNKVILKGLGKNDLFFDRPCLSKDLHDLYLCFYQKSSYIGLSYRFIKTGDDEYTIKDTIKLPQYYWSGGGNLTSDNLQLFLTLNNSTN